MILARIQHHPSRAHLVDKLGDSLRPLPVEVIEHSSEPPNPWLGYKRCLDTHTRSYKHLLVVQDDAIVCEDFVPAIRKVADRNPSNVVVLYLSRLPARISRMALRAAKRRECYVDVRHANNEFMPVVGVLWPEHQVRSFLRWTEQNPKKLSHWALPRSDDGVAGRWASLTKQTIRYTVPSLVQHPDEVPSLIGRDPQWGRDSGRTAQWFADGDVGRYEW